MWEQESFELMSGQEIDKLFNYCNLLTWLELWLSMVHPSCCSELRLLSSANSARIWEVQVRGVQVAQQVEWHHWQIQIWKWVWTNWHSIHACANSFFQQLVYAYAERVWYQHAPLANSRFNCELGIRIWTENT